MYHRNGAVPMPSILFHFRTYQNADSTLKFSRNFVRKVALATMLCAVIHVFTHFRNDTSEGTPQYGNTMYDRRVARGSNFASQRPNVISVSKRK